MHETYEDYLFSQGCFAAQPTAPSKTQAAEALVALVHYGEIRITAHPELATVHMLEIAQRNLGFDVPEPFYRGFPDSVRALSPFALLFDQLLQYVQTYGLGDFSEPKHSLFENYYGRTPLSEDIKPKYFSIITADEAKMRIDQAVQGFLASTRPLNNVNYALVRQYVLDHGQLPARCASKDTACRLIIDTRNPAFASQLELPDVIRLLEWMLELNYPDMQTNKLNLKNQDRKLITAMLDLIFERGSVDTRSCLEKKRTWAGLLHHIHYQPKCAEALDFCAAVRGNKERSAYSDFSRLLQAGDVRGATEHLRTSKGATAVVRNLVYLLSRCETSEDIDYVLDLASTKNKIVLVQLLTKLNPQAQKGRRVFSFVHLNKMRRHIETYEEMSLRKSVLSDDVTLRVLQRLEDMLKRSCQGTLGKVYADEAMKAIALPIQESASQGGYGVLPRGSRLDIPRGKKLRAFVYWEKVDDIDLSCFAINEQGDIIHEFSWRTTGETVPGNLVYSGDETSGYDGGSEYFDVDPLVFKESFPGCSLVFCANVYTPYIRFSNCVCRAGYMLRDELDSGKVFEPATVESSFTVNCSGSVAFLFALDPQNSKFIWLNVAENSYRRVAGTGDMSFLVPFLHTTNAINLYDFARMLATTVVDSPEDADVVFSDNDLALREGQEQIRSTDLARIIELLNS